MQRIGGKTNPVNTFFIPYLLFCRRPVEEKTRKVKDYRERYASWWLVLVDHIAHGFEENERKELRSMIGPIISWDKVIVLDSLSGNGILEI